MEILELKNTVSERKNPSFGLHCRMEMSEEGASELGDRTIEIIQSENRGKE